MKYEIWIEGYRANGDSAQASKLGESNGETFKDACIEFMKTFPHPELYNPVNNTYWSSQLFNNEADARKGYG